MARKSDRYMGKLGWGTYRDWEGPVYLGDPWPTYDAGPHESFRRRVLRVFTATESAGRYNPVNAYDRCGVSPGLIQLCEFGVFAASGLLHLFIEANADLFYSWWSEMDTTSTFDLTLDRFVLSGEPVRSLSQQRALWFGGATGLKSSWTDQTRATARRSVCVLAGLFAEPQFREVQVERLVNLPINYFVTPAVQRLLFPNGYPTEGWEGALRAMYLSFAGNLPAVASEAFLTTEATRQYHDAPPEQRFRLLATSLAQAHNIAIYPARLRSISPQLERLFGISIPWVREVAPKSPVGSRYQDVKQLQQALITLGFDLGPKGADGIAGPKTRAAIKEFEVQHGLPEDGIPDPTFLEELERDLVAQTDLPPAIKSAQSVVRRALDLLGRWLFSQ